MTKKDSTDREVRAAAKRKKERLANRTLEKLLQRLKIPPDSWDYFIVSDGSGTILDKPCGWASILVQRKPVYTRKVFYGAMNTGTNIMAEMMGFTQALLWLSRQNGRPEFAKVHILTDCETVRNCASGRATRKKNAEMWHFVGALQRRLGSVEFHWMPRESTNLNRLADRVAGLARKLLLSDLIEQGLVSVGKGKLKSVDELNPA
jgi:ribonuclease HI